jgi:hypothetical protein
MHAQTGMATQFAKWGLITSLDDSDATEDAPPKKKKKCGASGGLEEHGVLRLGPAGSDSCISH